MPDRRKSIQLTPEESRKFMEEARTAMLATNGRDGYPHLIAMWYALKDGDIVMTTYGKSQKAVNIRRDPRATMMWEAETAYSKLRELSTPLGGGLGGQRSLDLNDTGSGLIRLTVTPAAMTERLTPTVDRRREEDEELDADKVFAKLSALKKTDEADDEE